MNFLILVYALSKFGVESQSTPFSESSEYASSCEEENAEDGMLYYDGFTVWTVRNADGELVHDVYRMD
mgnify:CR=1 FL=1